MEGMGLILACHSLSFLKLALWSLEKFSLLDNELVIVVDRGAEPIDCTQEWLKSNNYLAYDVDFNDPYKTWDFGVEKATKDFVCIIPQDFVFSPGWDLHLAKHLTPKTGVLSVIINPDSGDYWGPRVVECNCCKPTCRRMGYQNIQCAPKDFDLYKFLRKAEEIKRPNETDDLDWFQPFAINRKIFIEIGGFYNDCCNDKPWPELHEDCTFQKLRDNGIEIRRSLDSVVYHLGSSGIMAKSITAEEGWEYDPWKIYG